MDEELITIIAEESGERIDALLARSLGDFSRSQIQKLILSGMVTSGGRAIKKNYKCTAGELIELIPPEIQELELIPQDIELDVVYEDSDIIVINKPRGMVVHPAPGHYDNTLVNALLYHCGESLSGIGGEKRPGIVHRIDKDTSGLIAVAKNDNAHRQLSAQLADHSMFREYEAIICGHLRQSEGTVNKPIARHPTDRKRMAVSDKGKNAVTHYELIADYKGYSHIRCRLETGRTHQIRIHMASLAHPLLGDALYGAKCPDHALEGQCLHARRLRLIHPANGRELMLETDLPKYFTDILEKLEKETLT